MAASKPAKAGAAAPKALMALLIIQGIHQAFWGFQGIQEHLGHQITTEPLGLVIFGTCAQTKHQETISW